MRGRAVWEGEPGEAGREVVCWHGGTQACGARPGFWPDPSCWLKYQRHALRYRGSVLF